MEITPAYARPAQAAKHFGVGKTTLWRWTKRSDFPQPTKIGPKITLFDVQAVDQWIKDQREGKR